MYSEMTPKARKLAKWLLQENILYTYRIILIGWYLMNSSDHKINCFIIYTAEMQQYLCVYCEIRQKWKKNMKIIKTNNIGTTLQCHNFYEEVGKEPDKTKHKPRVYFWKNLKIASSITRYNKRLGQIWSFDDSNKLIQKHNSLHSPNNNWILENYGFIQVCFVLLLRV